MLNLSILGPPGSGKGTQAEFLVDRYHLYHVDVGMELRKISREDTPLGRKVNDFINKKNILVPNDIVLDVLSHKLVQIPFEQGIILDGAPRRIDRVLPLEQMLEKLRRSLDIVIYLNVPEDLLIERIAHRYFCEKCGHFWIEGVDVQNAATDKCPLCDGRLRQREDDTPAGIRRRLEVFHSETQPVIDHYRKKGVLIEIDGRGSIDEVQSALKNALEKKFQKPR